MPTKKPTKAAPAVPNEMLPTGFSPSQDQIETLARRLMPEIIKFFADGQVQEEFAQWQERRSADK